MMTMDVYQFCLILYFQLTLLIFEWYFLPTAVNILKIQLVWAREGMKCNKCCPDFKQFMFCFSHSKAKQNMVQLKFRMFFPAVAFHIIHLLFINQLRKLFTEQFICKKTRIFLKQWSLEECHQSKNSSMVTIFTHIFLLDREYLL